LLIFNCEYFSCKDSSGSGMPGSLINIKGITVQKVSDSAPPPAPVRNVVPAPGRGGIQAGGPARGGMQQNPQQNAALMRQQEQAINRLICTQFRLNFVDPNPNLEGWFRSGAWSTSIWVPVRDVSLIFSSFHLFAVISKLIDQPVWYLFKNDVFTLQVFGNRIQKKDQNVNSYGIGLPRKHQNETNHFAFCLRFDFIGTSFVFW
jgi:hypothetical protein